MGIGGSMYMAKIDDFDWSGGALGNVLCLMQAIFYALYLVVGEGEMSEVSECVK